MSSFKSIQKKEGGPDNSVSDNQSSSVTLNELAMKARKILYFRVSVSSENDRKMKKIMILSDILGLTWQHEIYDRNF